MNNITELWNVFVVCSYFITFILIMTDLEDLVLSNSYLNILIGIEIIGLVLGYLHH